MAGKVFQTFPILDDLDGFEECWSDVLQDAPLWHLSDVFLMIRRGFWVLGRPQSVSSYHRIRSTILSTGLITADVDLEHRAEAVFLRCHPCKVTLFSRFQAFLLERKSLCTSTLEE